MQICRGLFHFLRSLVLVLCAPICSGRRYLVWCANQPMIFREQAILSSKEYLMRIRDLGFWGGFSKL